MSPKRRVAVMTAIFAAVGIGVSVGIIAAGGGFSSGRGPDIFNPPTNADIWVVGNNIEDGMSLDYSVATARGEAGSLESAQVSMVFQAAGDNWDVTFTVTNDTTLVENTVTMSKGLTREGQLDSSFRPYFDPIQRSIFAVRDMEYGQSPKYLVVGAPWEQIFYKSSEVIVRVTNEETVQTQAGSFDAFVLSYKLEENTSKVWIVQDMPLPVKAEVYDADDILQYEYELVGAA